MTFLWYVTEQYGICPFNVHLLASHELEQIRGEKSSFYLEFPSSLQFSNKNKIHCVQSRLI